MDGDRERWNETWRERAGELEEPAGFLVDHAELVPKRGKALDVAGGAGRHALWLARRGLDVTLADISDVGLTRAERRAEELGLGKRMRFLRLDLDEPVALAPLFDVVLVVHYLNRARRTELAELLVPEGVLIAAQPTVKNLEKHASPSRAYLAEEGELETWVRGLGLDVLYLREDWNGEGRHEEEVIARRSPRAEPPEPEPEPQGTSEGPYR